MKIKEQRGTNCRSPDCDVAIPSSNPAPPPDHGGNLSQPLVGLPPGMAQYRLRGGREQKNKYKTIQNI
jgi:hypothetical protein